MWTMRILVEWWHVTDWRAQVKDSETPLSTVLLRQYWLETPADIGLLHDARRAHTRKPASQNENAAQIAAAFSFGALAGLSYRA
jgi:hypothetical protein